jgi:hypothetical protein
MFQIYFIEKLFFAPNLMSPHAPNIYVKVLSGRVMKVELLFKKNMGKMKFSQA